LQVIPIRQQQAPPIAKKIDKFQKVNAIVEIANEAPPTNIEPIKILCR
jgi:hypothetical protein